MAEMLQVMVEGNWDGNCRFEGEGKLTPQLLITSSLECVCISGLGDVFNLRVKYTFIFLPVPVVHGLYELIYRNLFTKNISKWVYLSLESQVVQLIEAINANKFESVNPTVLGNCLYI